MSKCLPVDFVEVDMEEGWERPAGYPAGVEAKVLSGGLDETGRTGRCTILQRYAPGTEDPRVLVHDFVEEVWILDGELLWLDEDGGVAQRLPKNSYVCRPPRVPHGPFRSDTGSLVLAIFYYP